MKRTFLITGATGYLGSVATKYFISCGDCVIAIIRDEQKAKEYLGDEGAQLK